MSIAHFDMALLDGRVAHQRMFPSKHGFSYGVFYRAEALGVRRSHFKSKDHGYRDGRSMTAWADDLLHRAGMQNLVSKVVLLAMPRVWGYVFNPVSFWMCLDSGGNLRAVLCEVNNTFGESHTYVCSHPDQSVITCTDCLEAEKVFHVSPFMDRCGKYAFQFSIKDDRLAIQINHFDADGRLKLRTSLSGAWLADSFGNRVLLRLKYPLISLRAIALIHYHAAWLVLKKIGYRAKPEQLDEKFSFVRRVPSTTKNLEEIQFDDQ